jgi:hypothetical protein
MRLLAGNDRAPERIPGASVCTARCAVSWSGQRTEQLIRADIPNRSAPTGLVRQVFTASATTCEPGPGDHAGTFGADVIAALRCVAEMINQWLQFGPSGG